MVRAFIIFVMLLRTKACRWIAYLGKSEIDGKELLLDPSHNILNLARKEPVYTPGARASSRWNASQFLLRNVDENQDGFGIIWYTAGSDFARRIRSADPLVTKNDQTHELLSNLLSVAVQGGGLRGGSQIKHLKKSSKYFIAANNTCQSDASTARDDHVENILSRQRLKSRAILAHVRAASTGKLETKNAHPFTFNTLSWVHNGAIAGFDQGTGHLIKKIHQNTFGGKLVAGDTDSEWAGAIFVNNLSGFPRGPTYPIHALRAAMRKTIREIADLAAQITNYGSSLNFAVTDGQSLVVTRFRTDPAEDPPTLYYKKTFDGIIVASEPLDTRPDGLAQWTLLGKDRMLSFSPIDDYNGGGAELIIECIEPSSSACDSDLPLRISSSSSSFHAISQQRRRRESSSSNPYYYQNKLRHSQAEFPYTRRSFVAPGADFSSPGIITK